MSSNFRDPVWREKSKRGDIKNLNENSRLLFDLTKDFAFQVELTTGQYMASACLTDTELAALEFMCLAFLRSLNDDYFGFSRANFENIYYKFFIDRIQK
jgi:hypothetical protein